ncbi:MAG: cell division protein FtsL [Congregibacter sp.]
MLVWVCLLIGLVLLSAFAVIASTHTTRDLYAQLQDVEAERWHLEEEYSRLLLEQSTWASHHRIETQAAEALGLSVPGRQRLRLVAQ